jgi:hypothetical protein
MTLFIGSFDAFTQSSSAKSGKHGPRNIMEAVRDGAKVEREVEEARLRKRQKRLNPEGAQNGSRAGSAAPGVPGASAAPESEAGATKAPSKKELKKGAAAARLAEASSTASTNQTLSTLMGGFGRKRKEYSWMQKSGSGASTPSKQNAGDAGAAAAGGGPKVPEKTQLTGDPRYPRLGTWREDKEKGKNIQLRDWVTVLELDGIEIKAIQEAYLKLDSSTPKDRS